MVDQAKEKMSVQQSPNVSVIMNCFNCSKYVRDAIDSVYAQTYRDWEIIFWDNASTDGSAEIAKSYDEKLKYFKGDTTVPLYTARNYALEKANGRVIAFLDCDDLWLPEKLEKQIPLFANPRVGIVYSNTIFLNQQTGKETILYKKRPPSGNIFNKLLARYFFSLETVMIRRSCLNDLPEWFDKRFDMVGDADLFTRIAHRWEVDYVDEPLAKWRIHENNLSFKKMEAFPKEQELVLDKYFNLYENFGSEYASEIKTVKIRITLEHALAALLKNNRKEARLRLKPYVLSNIKAIILYLSTYAPSFLADRYLSFKYQIVPVRENK